MPFFIAFGHLYVVTVPFKVKQGVVLLMSFRFLETPTESILYQFPFLFNAGVIPPRECNSRLSIKYDFHV